MADICDDLFSLNAEVVADGNGWTVVLREEEDSILNGKQFAALQGICMLLQRYAVSLDPIEGISEASEIRQARREGKANRWAGLSRKLDDLRDRLVRIESSGVPAVLATL